MLSTIKLLTPFKTIILGLLLNWTHTVKHLTNPLSNFTISSDSVNEICQQEGIGELELAIPLR